MMAPPGMPNMTSTPSRISASHMICAPVRFSVILKPSLFQNRAIAGVCDQPGISRQPASAVFGVRCPPLLAPFGQLGIRDLEVQRAGGEVDVYHVTIANQPDWPALHRFGG